MHGGTGVVKPGRGAMAGKIKGSEHLIVPIKML